MKSNRSKFENVEPRRWQGLPDEHGRRRSIYLGPLSKDDAREIRGHLRSLERAKANSVPITAASAAWLNSIGGDLRDKIAAEGLCEPRAERKASAFTLAVYIGRYIERRTDLGRCALLNLRQSEAKLVEHFGKARKLDSITVGDAKGFRHWLEGQRYAGATISMFVKKARQFFRDAVDHELLKKNPFKDVPAGTQVNPATMRYVRTADVELLIAATKEWPVKLILAFGRYGGLRCPSEASRLKWSDIDFEANKIHVQADKTKKQGKPERQVPIHPRLAQLLSEAFTLAADGEKRIIPIVDTETNLRTKIGRLCDAAGVKKWPKPLQNLRLSCETDWMDTDGVALACKWSGNTPEVAFKHYHLVRDEDFMRVKRRGAESSAASGANTVQDDEPNKTPTAASGESSSTCESMHSDALAAAGPSIPPRGVEPLSSG